MKILNQAVTMRIQAAKALNHLLKALIQPVKELI